MFSLIINLFVFLGLSTAFVFYSKFPLRVYFLIGSIVFLLTMFWGSAFWGFFYFILFALGSLFFYLPASIRKPFLTGKIYRLMQEKMPSISQTEQEAIGAGTVWWDAELFSGKPNFEKLFNVPKPVLTEEETDFINGPTEKLCNMLDDWEITSVRNDLPKNIWQFIKKEKFFALNINKKYGGLGFSLHAQSCIVQKISSRSGTAAVTVMVPNSLGPAELLWHYGTEKQKKHYLPRLASGAEIPCFALTNPWAGSDASSLPDYGVVCEQKINGKKTLGFLVVWEKRYITLAPVATLLGLAFRAYDPDHLLGKKEDLGMTCALIPTKTSGVEIGSRHLPLNASFQNGPNNGKEVFVPMEWIIGGRDRVGQGWKMLMECLAAGRGVSLPAISAGTAKLALRTSGAYSVVREQFGLSIGDFEGVSERLGRMGGMTYLLDGSRCLMNSALALGEKPAVLSAIVKQQCTELSRQVINDAMDVHGGKGICMGPSNYLARMYQCIPIGITVEGANILTRSLIIFGQGVLRSHPYLLLETKALKSKDEEKGLEKFDALFLKHVEYFLGNALRSLTLGITGSHILEYKKQSKATQRKTRKIARFSANFALVADAILLTLGGSVKRKEMLSGRCADALSYLFLASSAVKRYVDDGEDPKEKIFLDWACSYAFYQIQEALYDVIRNMPNRFVALMLRALVFPLGKRFNMPNDSITLAVSKSLQTDSYIRERVTKGVFIPENESEAVTKLESAMSLMLQTHDLRTRLRKQKLTVNFNQSYEEWVRDLNSELIISDDEAHILKATYKAVKSAIWVDDFKLDDKKTKTSPNKQKKSGVSKAKKQN